MATELDKKLAALNEALQSIGATGSPSKGAGRFNNPLAFVSDDNPAMRDHIRQLEDDERRTEILNDPLVNDGFRCGYLDVIKNLPND